MRKLPLFLLLALGVAFTSLAYAQAPAPVVPTFRLGTGSPAGVYHNVVYPALREQARGTLTVQEVLGTAGREGSGDNLECLQRKACDGVIIQSDALNVFLHDHPGSQINYEVAASSLYREAVHLICSHDADISRITKLKKGQKVQVGPDAGGTSTTWTNLTLADAGRYKPIATGTMSGARAANYTVEQTDGTVCMMIVVGPGAPAMATINDIGAQTHKLSLVSDDDSDLLAIKGPKGQPVYTSMSLPRSTYPGLMDGSVNVAAVSAMFLVSTDWIDANPAAYDKLISFINRAIPNIRNAVHENG